MSVASKLTNEIIDFIYRNDGYAFRASSVGIFDQKAGKYRSAAKKGVSDILACRKGKFIAIEVKIGKDRLSLEQEGFLQNITTAGGDSYVAKDFEQFKEWWENKYPAS